MPNVFGNCRRQFGEVLAQLTAARAGLVPALAESQADLLRRLKLERVVSREVPARRASLVDPLTSLHDE
jgi:type I restriction enzyme R subunit